MPWHAVRRPLIAGVSSFGMGGTNCHVVIAEAPKPGAARRARAPGRTADHPIPFILSGKNQPALEDQARNLRAHLQEHPELAAEDLAYSLARTRPSFARRAVVTAEGREGLLAGLEVLSRGEVAPGVVLGQARSGRTVFVFPGQGSQWEGMAVGLLDGAPVFAESIRGCGVALSRYVDWSLEDVLRGVGGAPSLERVEVVQPALFAVMVSLAALWRSFGVEPDVVVGHSQGEIAAAFVAGGLSLDDAARVVALRSQAVADQLAGRGGMVSVALTAADAEGLIGRFGERLSLAAVNGPASVVVSGELGALGELVAGCEREGVWAREIPVDYPSHSARVEDLRERLAEELGPIRPQSGRVPFFSTVTAEVIDTAGLDGGYWYRNLRHQVRFNDVISVLLADGTSALSRSARTRSSRSGCRKQSRRTRAKTQPRWRYWARCGATTVTLRGS